jgi:SAM-dependent methyltransferase
MSVIWHDIECGAYTEDLPVWRALADRHGSPILDLGAGTGRVALDLARRGHAVTGLDLDPELIDELRRRARDEGLENIDAASADARAFELHRTYAVCVIPMQTIQLLGGPEGRTRCLQCARAHLNPGGILAIAIVETVECYEELEGVPGPLPDMLERDGVVYFSQPTAVRAGPDVFVLERRRERVSADGARSVEDNVIRLDALSAGQLESEAAAVGLTAHERIEIPASADHVGSLVVVLYA